MNHNHMHYKQVPEVTYLFPAYINCHHDKYIRDQNKQKEKHGKHEVEVSEEGFPVYFLR